ncbi:hypothetical protein YW7DRAFT_07176 [Streptomyces sp. AmelKG-E11A]|nr:hypothetical protein YW7DRAFT_07176 [Streptomyces sp. AmelKG-E11A]
MRRATPGGRGGRGGRPWGCEGYVPGSRGSAGGGLGRQGRREAGGGPGGRGRSGGRRRAGWARTWRDYCSFQPLISQTRSMLASQLLPVSQDSLIVLVPSFRSTKPYDSVQPFSGSPSGAPA